MTNQYAMTLAFVSMVFLGCASAAVDNDANKTSEALQAAEKSANVAQSGYGYEMIPLKLVPNAVAPQGNAIWPNGRIAPEELVRQATTRIAALQGCYAAALDKNPTQPDQVVVKLEFSTDGILDSVIIDEPTTIDADLGHCIKNVMSTMQLPASNAGVLTVYYPIDLHSAVFAK